MKKLFTVIVLLLQIRNAIAQCTFTGAYTATLHVSFQYYSGNAQFLSCSAIGQSHFNTAGSSNAAKMKINFFNPPDNHPGFRVWGLNTSDSISIEVNTVNYPLTSSSASITSVFSCGTSVNSTAALFANNYLVGTETSSSETKAYADVILNTNNVSSIVLYSKGATGWGFAGALSSCTILPVTLLSFKATKWKRSVLLQWNTATEINSSYFEVESSKDALEWQTIGRKNASGNSNSTKQYSLENPQPLAGYNYYRLKQVDIDGKYTYSGIEVVYINYNLYTISPNPFTNHVDITGDDIRSVVILNATGKQLIHKQCNFANNNSIDLQEYPAGIYFARIVDSAGKYTVQKLVKL